MKFTKLIRNKKAISPIFATLILIAIAVIAGIVVYMFTSGTIAGMTGGGTAGQEKLAVQSASYTATDTVIVLVQSTGGPLPTINGVIIKDSTGNVVGQDLTIGTTLADGVLTQITTVAMVPGLTSGSYTATVTTQAGGSFVSPTFTVA